MNQIVKAIVDESGAVSLLEEVRIVGTKRALVTIFDDPVTQAGETALLAESTLQKDWLRPEEDEAWAYLQPAK